MSNNDRHVYPLDEEHLHIVSGPTSGVDCPCKPRVEVVGSDLVVVHNSFDHREIVEEAIEIMNNNDGSLTQLAADGAKPHPKRCNCYDCVAGNVGNFLMRRPAKHNR